MLGLICKIKSSTVWLWIHVYSFHTYTDVHAMSVMGAPHSKQSDIIGVVLFC